MRFIVCFVLAATLAVGAAAQSTLPVLWEESIEEYLAQDRVSAPPEGGILFVGSSFIRQWTTLEGDMSPLPVINRGFGGSRSHEVLYYMERIVLPYRPSIIVYYAGANDVDAGVPAEEIAGNFRKFADRVAGELPETRVFFVSVIRAPQKRARWKVVDDANSRVREFVIGRKNLGYIEVNPPLFEEKGNARMGLYLEDQLHFNADGYAEMTKVIRPIIEAAYLK
jgi:lysophospholipase L1-like esterase